MPTSAAQAATRHKLGLEVLRSVRLLVVRDHWKNVGMGFMPGQVPLMHARTRVRCPLAAD